MKNVNKLPLISGLSLAAVSLWFSGTGLVHLFAGAGMAIICMVIAFEVAKVSLTVWLMQNLRLRFLPVALGFALLCLTGISSIGVYGYLGRAYDSGRVDAKVVTSEVGTVRSEIAALEADKNRLYRQVEGVAADQGTNRRRILTSITPQVSRIDSLLTEKRAALAAMSKQQVTADADIGELRFAADLFGTTQEALARLIITVLAFLLDPLAVMLLLASGVKSRTPRQQELDRVLNGGAVRWEGEAAPTGGFTPRKMPYTLNDITHDPHVVIAEPSDEVVERMAEYLEEAGSGDPDIPCLLPPEGWYCTRGAAHKGPCAAHPIEPSTRTIRRDILSNHKHPGLSPALNRVLNRRDEAQRDRSSRRVPERP